MPSIDLEKGVDPTPTQQEQPTQLPYQGPISKLFPSRNMLVGAACVSLMINNLPTTETKVISSLGLLMIGVVLWNNHASRVISEDQAKRQDLTISQPGTGSPSKNSSRSERGNRGGRL